MKVQASAPGKLFLAGEYAVVEPGYPALIAAIDQYLTVGIESSQEGSIYSSQQGVFLLWSRQGESLSVCEEHPYSLILSAIETVEEYTRAKGLATGETYALRVETALDHAESGQKYGLGSSGAVTVATVRAVLAFYGLADPSYLVYQLSAISQVRLEMTGSFGDLAASSFGGLLTYHSLDRVWLREKLARQSLLEVLESPWQGVRIDRLTLPSPLSLLIGWTGLTASTDTLVQSMMDQRTQAEKAAYHQVFLEKSRSCVEGLLQACQDQDSPAFLRGIRENRQLLQDFARTMDLTIETPALTQLCQLALEEGGVAKSSGAGGGDCGICFVVDKQVARAIYQKWQVAGIQPLAFSIATIQ